MPKPKTTAAQKREKLLNWFYTSNAVWTSKDILKKASKETGIASMIIADVLKELTDEGLVDCDKIGSSNYFWAFPSKGLQTKRNELAKVELDLEEASSRKRKLTQALGVLEEGREDTPVRQAGLSNLKRLRAEASHLAKELDALKEVDPAAVAKKQQQTTLAKEAANRWTDNVFAARQWCLDKMGGSMSEEDFNRQFGIPQELDFLE
mmetsp:Transcript_25148/g.65610  ORF Transcript_25148/g.65610 Transcript_25148/m.65610 type:complete len:207 (+) Transcript_25148:55-675(+)